MDVLDRLHMDVPVAQAGMGSMAPAELAAAVAAAGGLGTIGFTGPHVLEAAIDRVHDSAPGRAVAVNLLMPFAKRRHVEVCVRRKVHAVVLAFGGDAMLVRELQEANIFVFVLVGTEQDCRRAVAWGADGLIAQGVEAGGHLAGYESGDQFLSRAIASAGTRPVFRAGGIATSGDTRAALDAGAAGVVAGTRFLLTHESAAHPAYQQRVLSSRKTLETTLFGLSWPARHRVVPNRATDRWCDTTGKASRLPSLLSAKSSPLARFAAGGDESGVLQWQRPGLPVFSPAAPVRGLPDEWIERSALYAGESALRMERVVSAKEALEQLSPG
ncbi:nitronate monooxygenase [Aldersonia sp. NBC_00410]|uniref:NAD(P)H-dependent flavin oxidoreductase n=1 Tax=Aldersonia sp. NBC_00410 TaxID=2975954 RepID=UPI002250BBC3|nr:nitronate monooxygenase [Aldersonia sp. NBC_00410]MCX5042962.1 nitronate monooxygenase [Aldersonia sp. NBC_00410]